MRYQPIGIIGGIGPLASVYFEQLLLEKSNATTDQEYPVLIHFNNSQVPDRTAFLVGNGEDPVPSLQHTIDTLVAAGAQILAMPCNTAHALVERLVIPTHVTFINMFAETVDIVTKTYPGIPVGVLCTDGTRAGKTYDMYFAGSENPLLYPDTAHQALVMEAIYGEEGIKSGHIDGPRAQLTTVCDHLRTQGAGIILTACTELPLALTEYAVPLVDPMQVLADATLRASRVS